MTFAVSYVPHRPPNDALLLGVCAMVVKVRSRDRKEPAMRMPVLPTKYGIALTAFLLGKQLMVEIYRWTL